MAIYIIGICKLDGSTPLGQCPEYEVEAETHYDAQSKILQLHPDYETVHWGLKTDMERIRK